MCYMRRNIPILAILGALRGIANLRAYRHEQRGGRFPASDPTDWAAGGAAAAMLQLLAAWRIGGALREQLVVMYMYDV